jgi:hypothetical protein
VAQQQPRMAQAQAEAAAEEEEVHEGDVVAEAAQQ